MIWNLTSKLIEHSQQLRAKLFGPVLQRAGVTATQLTLTSFACGIISVAFFKSPLLFTLFGAAHILLDALDGVVARATEATEQGRYIDWISDQIATILLMFAITQAEPAQFNKVITILYVTYISLFFLSSMRIPPMSARTALFVSSFAGFYQLGMSIALIITLYGYATAYHQTFFSPKTYAR